MLVKRFVAIVVCGLWMSAALDAQWTIENADPPPNAPLRFGPIALAPAISVSNVGWDSNVFQQENGEGAEDFTATTIPRVQGWMRLGRARFRGGAILNFFYFQDHPSERSVDTNYSGRLDLDIARLTPYVSTRWVDAKQPSGFEVNDRIRRHEDEIAGGVMLDVGPGTTIDLGASRRRDEFRRPSNFQDPVVTGFDDYTSQGVSASLRHDLTPFTSMVVTVDKHEDRFDDVPERDTNSVGFSSGVEFRPFAMISGHAYVGRVRLQLVNSKSAPFEGLTSAIDLAYRLFDATRFTLGAERTVEYSAVRNQEAYLLGGLTASVNHRFGETWDGGARIGRYHLTYGLFEGSDVPSVSSGSYTENVRQYGGDLGYRVGPHLRVAVLCYHQSRRSALGSARGYRRTVVGMNANYVF